MLSLIGIVGAFRKNTLFDITLQKAQIRKLVKLNAQSSTRDGRNHEYSKFLNIVKANLFKRVDLPLKISIF